MLKLRVGLTTIVFLPRPLGEPMASMSGTTGAEERFTYFCLFVPGDAEALLLAFAGGLPFFSQELDVAKEVCLVIISFSFDLALFFLTLFSGIQSKKLDVLMLDMRKESDTLRSWSADEDLFKISMREGGLILSLSSLLSMLRSGATIIPSGMEALNFRALLSLVDLDLWLMLPNVSSLPNRSGTEGNPCAVADNLRGRVGALWGCRMAALRRFEEPTCAGERVFSSSERSAGAFSFGLDATGLLPYPSMAFPLREPCPISILRFCTLL